MFSVWKYTLKAQEYQMVEIPVGAKVVSAEEQHDQIVVYAMVDFISTDDCRLTEFIIIGTGHPTSHVLSEYQFLDTVKMENGNLMFHVFYR